MSKLTVLFAFVGVSMAVAQFDKSKAIGPCINGRCPDGHVCHENECFPTPPPQQQSDDSMNELFNDETQQRAQPIGPCINSLCPAGYTCNQADYKCY